MITSHNSFNFALEVDKRRGALKIIIKFPERNWTLWANQWKILTADSTLGTSKGCFGSMFKTTKPEFYWSCSWKQLA